MLLTRKLTRAPPILTPISQPVPERKICSLTPRKSEHARDKTAKMKVQSDSLSDRQRHLNQKAAIPRCDSLPFFFSHP